MRVEITPRRLDVVPGAAVPLTITVTNTGTVIAGFTVRILGADPSWVDLDQTDFSLFPDESRVVSALIEVPEGIAAGERRIAVQVRELTPPESSAVEEIVLHVPEQHSVQLRADPVAVTAGRTARFSLVVDNTGNTAAEGELQGLDPEGKVTFRFSPPSLSVGPGEHAIVDLRASARGPLFGAPVIRLLDLRFGTPAEPVVNDPAAAVKPKRTAGDRLRAARTALRGDPLGLRPVKKKARRTRAVADDDARPMANATYVQKPVFSRGALSLVGLLAAITVFAVVITLALSRLVGQSAADRNLALEIASARDASGSGVGTSSLSGVVTLLTSGSPVAGVAVSVFDAADTTTPLVTTATGDDGTYGVTELPAGDYKVTFRGAGFVQLWYPQAIDAADATTVTLAGGDSKNDLDVALGGVPATISGTVKGDDVAAATLTLKTPLGVSGPIGADPTASSIDQEATVRSVPIGSDGTFELLDVPSPSVYDLVVTKQGFATSTQRIDVGAGETRDNVELTLLQGDGVISGTVNSASGPLGGVTITATSGQSTVTTQSLTEGSVGTFTLRSLPTPATFTVVASLEGYASQTLTLTLADGQRLTGVSLTLGKSAGTLSGTVTESPAGTAAPGVLVTVTDGAQTVRTVTQSSGNVGQWKVGGLAIPGTYTVTFARSDLASQTVSVVLDATGAITPGSQGATITAKGISVAMQSSTAVVQGLVTQRGAASSPAPAGEVTVQLSSGTAVYTVTTASVPAGSEGRYRIDGVPPGTYTVSVSRNGVSPTSEIIELAAGEVRDYSPVLAAAASIAGTVVDSNGTPVGPGWYIELYRSSEYPGTVYRVTTTTDAAGSFVFDNIDAPEAYVIEASRTRGSPPSGSTTVQVEASQRATARITVPANE